MEANGILDLGFNHAVASFSEVKKRVIGEGSIEESQFILGLKSTLDGTGLGGVIFGIEEVYDKHSSQVI